MTTSNTRNSFSTPTYEDYFEYNWLIKDFQDIYKETETGHPMISERFTSPPFYDWHHNNDNYNLIKTQEIEIDNSSFNFKKSDHDYMGNPSFYNLDVELDFNLLKEIYIESEMREIEELKMIVSKRIIKMINDDNWDEILILGWQTQNHDLKDIALEYIYNNWKKLESADKMNELLKCGDARWVREIIMASIFGINNGSRLYNFRN
uniref:Uncharacterized protein n=1 Tax=Rhizophagus irregularis (strain DAOM 181602 / DAOM 197198 / MUCL 43194) TaxID=747089 RepID=U9TIL2_RHIID